MKCIVPITSAIFSYLNISTWMFFGQQNEIKISTFNISKQQQCVVFGPLYCITYIKRLLKGIQY